MKEKKTYSLYGEEGGGDLGKKRQWNFFIKREVSFFEIADWQDSYPHE